MNINLITPFKRTRLPILLLILLLLNLSCEKIDALFEDTNFYIENNIMAHPITLQFVDANRESGMAPIDIKLKYAGPDADKIFSADGKLEPKASNGFLDLFVVRSNYISVDNPLEFTITASARGYQDIIKSYVLRDTAFKLELVGMVNLSAPPSGVAREASAFSTGHVDANDRMISTIESEQVEEKINVTIQQGTQMFDDNNNQISGRVDYKLIQYDIRNPESMNAFPGNLESNSIITKEGNTIENQYFTTIGFYSLDMNAGAREITKFSKPLKASLELEDGLFNPEAGRTLQVGDKIPVWSFLEESLTWQYEGDAEVAESDNGQLVANYEMPHLSYWNLGWVNNNCESYMTIMSDLVGADSTAALNTFLVQTYVVTQDENGLAKEAFQKSFLQDLSNNTEIIFTNASSPNGAQSYRFRIFEGTGCNPDALVYVTPIFTLACDQTALLDLSGALPIRGSSQAIRTTVDVSGYCRYENNANDVIIRPTLRIFFREAGCSTEFSELGEIKSGEGVFYGIEKGKTYDFLISIPEDSRILYDITIPLSSGTVDIPDFDEDVQFTYQSETDVLMEYLNVKIPDDICDAWKDIFGE